MRSSKFTAEKKGLLRSLETSRKQISGDLGAVGDQLNVAERFRESFGEHSFKWIGGGIIAGALLAIMGPMRFRRKRDKSEQVKRGLVGTAFFGLLGIVGKQILMASLPSVQRMAQDGFQQWYGARFGGVTGAAEPPELEE